MKAIRYEEDRKTDLSAFGPDEDRLAAIRRTVEATDADGIDVGGLAARAVEAYWTDREEQIQADLAAAKEDNSGEYRALPGESNRRTHVSLERDQTNER